MTAAPLSNTDWTVTGHEIVAWINDLELFDITFDGRTQRFALRLNNVAEATTLFLGLSDSLSEAMGRAASYDGSMEVALEVAAMFNIDPAEEEPDQFRCNHGRTLVEPCPGCAVEFGETPTDTDSAE